MVNKNDGSNLADLIKDIKGQYLSSDIFPIIIAAPTQRCGTTLLQRAINSGKDAIIYGENFFLLEKYPYLIGGGLQNFEEKSDITKSVFSAFESGKAGVDATALFPDFYEYSKKTVESLYLFMEHYADHAKNSGFKHWGIKHQPSNIKGFINFLNLCPSVKMVFIYRDLLDVAASYKARWPNSLSTEEDLRRFANRWSENISAMRFYDSKQCSMYVIKYESLIVDIKGHVEQLSSFLDIQVDKKIFDEKINAHFVMDDITSEDIKDRETDGKYIEPVKLTDSEIKLLIAETNGLYKKLKY